MSVLFSRNIFFEKTSILILYSWWHCLLFLLLFSLGQPQSCSKLTPGSVLRHNSWWGSGNPMSCHRFNMGELCARQMAHQQYIFSVPRLHIPDICPIFMRIHLPYFFNVHDFWKKILINMQGKLCEFFNAEWWKTLMHKDLTLHLH